MASRGRGRGKDISAVLSSQKARKEGQSSGSQGTAKIPKSIGQLETYLFSLSESNFQLYGAKFAEMVIGYSSSEEKLRDAVFLIYNTTVSNRDSAALGAKVCEEIINQEVKEASASSIPANFRNVLISHFQADFKQRDQIRGQSVESWLGVFSFLCHFYQRIKIGGQPISVMGKPILTSIENILEKPDVLDDEIDCICTHLKVCGGMLELSHAEKLEQVFISLRKLVIKRHTSCMVRCVVLELIEYRRMGWQDPHKVLDKFYVDALADAVAEDELEHN